MLGIVMGGKITVLTLRRTSLFLPSGHVPGQALLIPWSSPSLRQMEPSLIGRMQSVVSLWLALGLAIAEPHPVHQTPPPANLRLWLTCSWVIHGGWGPATSLSLVLLLPMVNATIDTPNLAEAAEACLTFFCWMACLMLVSLKVCKGNVHSIVARLRSHLLSSPELMHGHQLHWLMSSLERLQIIQNLVLRGLIWISLCWAHAKETGLCILLMVGSLIALRVPSPSRLSSPQFTVSQKPNRDSGLDNWHFEHLIFPINRVAKMMASSIQS
jgi:hypothetical protein